MSYHLRHTLLVPLIGNLISEFDTHYYLSLTNPQAIARYVRTKRIRRYFPKTRDCTFTVNHQAHFIVLVEYYDSRKKIHRRAAFAI